MSIFDSELFHKELGLEAIKKEGKYYQALSKRSTYPSLSNRLKKQIKNITLRVRLYFAKVSLFYSLRFMQSQRNTSIKIHLYRKKWASWK